MAIWPAVCDVADLGDHSPIVSKYEFKVNIEVTILYYDIYLVF